MNLQSWGIIVLVVTLIIICGILKLISHRHIRCEHCPIEDCPIHTNKKHLNNVSKDTNVLFQCNCHSNIEGDTHV